MFTFEWPFLSRGRLLGAGFVSGAAAAAFGLLAVLAAAAGLAGLPSEPFSAVLARRAVVLALLGMLAFASFNLTRRRRNEGAFYGLSLGAAAAAMAGF